MSEKIFSISEAARYIGVFPLTLRNWEKRGLIRAFRTRGGHRRFRKSELDKIIGMEKKEDKIKLSIENLEGIDFENGRQKRLKQLITDLKNISKQT